MSTGVPTDTNKVIFTGEPPARPPPTPRPFHCPSPPLACALVVAAHGRPALMSCLLLLCDTVDTGENPGIKLLADDEETVLTHASFWRTILSPVRCPPAPPSRLT